MKNKVVFFEIPASDFSISIKLNRAIEDDKIRRGRTASVPNREPAESRLRGRPMKE